MRNLRNSVDKNNTHTHTQGVLFQLLLLMLRVIINDFCLFLFLRKPFLYPQVINNACATQALLSILLNCKHKDLELGETLTNFKEFTQDLDPGVCGLSNLALHRSFST